MTKSCTSKNLFFNKPHIIEILPYFMISLMLIPMTFFSRWGPIDDWNMLEYLIADTSRMQLVNTFSTSGRFFPLYRIEWDILSNISINPYLFYFFNFIEATIACYMLYSVCARYSQKITGFFAVFVLILSPAFVASFYKLGVPDKNSFFLFAIAIYIILNYFSLSDNSIKQHFYVLVALVATNLALYFKEPGFILVSVFATVFTILNYLHNKKWYTQNRKRILMIFGFSLASSFIFLISYIALPYLTDMNATLSNNYVTGFNPNADIIERFLLSFQSIIWFLFTDPLVIFVAPLILIFRLTKWKRIVQNINNPEDRIRLFVADSALAATLCYACFFIITAVINYHYLLPAYAFLLPALAVYADILRNKEIIKTKQPPKYINLHKIAIIILTLLLIGSFSAGINQMILLKYIPYNMNEFLDESIPIIESDLDSKLSDDNVNFFLLGVDKRHYVEIYHSFPAYLKLRGINNIDIKSVEEVDDNFLPNISAEYTAFRTQYIQIPESGDYIVVMPYSRKDENSMIKTLKKQHGVELENLYTTDNSYFIQFPFPIQIIRHIAKETGIYSSDEIFYWTAGYSLYIVK